MVALSLLVGVVTVGMSRLPRSPFLLAQACPSAPGTPDLDAASDTNITTDNNTSDDTPTFSGTCTTGYTVKLKEAATELGSVVCAGGVYAITSSVLIAATHVIEATQTDACESPVSSQLSVVVDTAFASLSPSPVDNATGVGLNVNLTLTLSESVTGVTGKSVVIKKTSDNTVVETIAADGAKVTISTVMLTTTITIDPSVTLVAGTEYYVTIDSGAFKDLAGNEYAGISSTTAWSFTTIGATCGDGIVGGSEACDEGANNGASGYCCASDCTFRAFGTSCRAAASMCDIAESCSGSAATCPPDTTNCSTCGDSTVQSYEECDDGNQTSGDGCSVACAHEFCGDGTLQSGLGEQCDDGNNVNNDGCTSTCTIPSGGGGNIVVGDPPTSVSCNGIWSWVPFIGDWLSSCATPEPPPVTLGGCIIIGNNQWQCSKNREGYCFSTKSGNPFDLVAGAPVELSNAAMAPLMLFRLCNDILDAVLYFHKPPESLTFKLQFCATTSQNCYKIIRAKVKASLPLGCSKDPPTNAPSC